MPVKQVHPWIIGIRALDIFLSSVQPRGLHGNGDGGNTVVMGTIFTVIPWGWGHVSRGYRRNGEQCRW